MSLIDVSVEPNMSIIDVPVEPNMTSSASPSAGAGPGRGVARRVRVALACAVLAISGGVRWWQVRQVEAALRDGRTAPFPLDTVPMVLGDWRGEETTIDPKIARRTGATDLMTRRYVDQRTGASLEAIILYGPTTEVYGHAPEVCYRAAGYEKVAGPEARAIKAGSLEVPFRSLVYSKGEGGQADLHEVYYSWRFTRHWSPDLMGTYKRFERIPGMLKVHLTRRVTGHERRDIGNPCEAFLRVLLPEVERRLAGAMPAAEQPKGTGR
jgi:hypothetical protein